MVHVSYFTERPYRWLDEDEVLRRRGFFHVSNAAFDPEHGRHDYNHYLDEFVYAEELGFDGLALNEHHANPFCMGAVVDVEAAILARITSRSNIVLIGNALPNKHPMRLAEELAMIDLISGGRLVSGWVRGAGSEQFANNVNPAYNREMFEEAHDLILKAWTEPGPWRHEGKHFHYRHLNPWALPYTQPHPPIWIPGYLSPETLIWSAERTYPYIALNTPLGPTCDLFDMYADAAAEAGYQAGPENFGYLIPMFLADTEEKAQEVGRANHFGGGHSGFARQEYNLPAGYNSRAAIERQSKHPHGSWLDVPREGLAERSILQQDIEVPRRRYEAEHAQQQANLQVLIGTPDTVVPKLRAIMEVLRPGMLVFFHLNGPISDEDRLRSLQLMGEHVLPEVKAYGAELGLCDAFERRPGSVKLRPGEVRGPVGDRDALKSIPFG